MSFESDLFTLLKTVTPRVFPDFAPAKTPRPFVTYQQIGGDVLNLLANVAPGVRNGYMQISVWSDTRAEALQVMRAIEDAMCITTAFVARPIGAAVADFDAEVPIYGCRQEFRCWHTP